MALAAVVLIIAGLIWDINFPINKHLWTSSFVCFVGGFSILFFVFFYVIIDLLGFQKWAFPLVLIGSNSILIYIAAEGSVDFKHTADYVFGGLIQYTSIIWQPFFAALSVTVVQLLLLYFLYKKKWFLKI